MSNDYVTRMDPEVTIHLWLSRNRCSKQLPHKCNGQCTANFGGIRCLWLCVLAFCLIGCQSVNPVDRSRLFSSFDDGINTEPDPTPQLRIEARSHTAQINRIDVDRAERYVVSASHDKSVRVWDATDGELQGVLRLPIGDGPEGEVYSVAISPDGTEIALGGWIGYKWGRSLNIYIFDRESRQLRSRIRDLPNGILYLDYSPDGRYLAASLAGSNGIRIYRTRDYHEVARDDDYRGSCYSVEFGTDNQLVTTSDDGYIRLYDTTFKLIEKKAAPGGKEPFSARFAPNGRRIAVGFSDSTEINVLSAQTLLLLASMDTKEIDNGNLSSVAWSRDGHTLYAGGRFEDSEGNNKLISWSRVAGLDTRSVKSAARNTIMGLHPLSDGDILVASQDPVLGRLNSKGNVVWKRNPGVLGYREYLTRDKFELSDQADFIDLKYSLVGINNQIDRKRVSWSLSALRLIDGPPERHLILPRLSAPGLKIENWMNTYYPTLNEQILPLKDDETSRCLAIDFEGMRFVLGTDTYLRFYDRSGNLLWKNSTPSVLAVNISNDNRYIVAALGDGTIRWYELADGQERLSLYIHPDEKRWVAWTPEGFYAATPEAESLIGYHLNRGSDSEADFVSVEQFREVFSRSDLVTRALNDEYPELAKWALENIGDVRNILITGGLAPLVHLMTPQRLVLDRRDFTLELALEDRGGGFGKVEYLVDGKPVNSAVARPFAPEIPGRKGYKRRFTLSQGQHQITILAYNARNQVASKPVNITVQVDDPVHRQPSLYVLSLGVTKYRDQSLNLRYAADDAIDFSAAMEKHGRGLYLRVVTRNLLDHEVTLQQIGDVFQEFAGRVEPQDVFVLFMAGHGTVIDGRYHFIPYDLIYSNQKAVRAGSLDEQHLKTLLSTINAEKRLLVIDSCHAGSVLPNLAYMSRGIDHKTAIDRLMQTTGQTILAAASEKQQALAGIIENGKGHGLFSHVLLKGLRGAADGLVRQDGQIDVEELARYINQEVPRISMEEWHYEQFPMHHVERNFPIVLSGEQ